MPGLNRHSKLVTPNQLLWIAIFGVGFSIYFFDIDVGYHMRHFGTTMREVMRFVFGSR